MCCWLNESLFSSNQLAIVDQDESLTYSELWQRITKVAEELTTLAHGRIGLLMRNCIDWVVIDLAANLLNITLVPLPSFFSDEQLKNIITTAKLSLVVTDTPERIRKIISTRYSESFYEFGDVFILTEPQPCVNNVAKITFTSGSSNEPKGVCISYNAIAKVVTSFYKELSKYSARHYCLLPLSTLLENIAGIYVSLMSQSTIFLNDKISIYSLNYANFSQLNHFLIENKINTIILVPQILKLFVFWYSQNKILHYFNFIAVGGAKVSASLIKTAHGLGLPVYEGYGLSESTSVVSLNTPENNKIASVGKCLPHIQLKFTDDNEIAVKGAQCLGYYDSENENKFDSDGYWLTGDIGYKDEQGFLHLLGRKKNLIITSLGRNISPEWLECELCFESSVMQAAVFCNNGTELIAVLVLSKMQVDLEEIRQRVNQRLPEYAHLRKLFIADHPFTISNRLMTQGGQPNRQKIAKEYLQLCVKHRELTTNAL